MPPVAGAAKPALLVGSVPPLMLPVPAERISAPGVVPEPTSDAAVTLPGVEMLPLESIVAEELGV